MPPRHCAIPVPPPGTAGDPSVPRIPGVGRDSPCHPPATAGDTALPLQTRLGPFPSPALGQGPPPLCHPQAGDPTVPPHRCCTRDPGSVTSATELQASAAQSPGTLGIGWGLPQETGPPMKSRPEPSRRGDNSGVPAHPMGPAARAVLCRIPTVKGGLSRPAWP